MLRDTLVERGKRYGKFIDHARVSTELKEVVNGEISRRCLYLQADQREAISMICHKLGRIVCGDPNYADSWVDIAGYATLIASRLQGEEEL